MPAPTHNDHPRDVWTRRAAAAVLLCLVGGLFWFQASLIRTRTYDPDEFQHTHSAFLISEGQAPYRDYFEHHPPLLHFLAAPVLAHFQPARDSDRALEALATLRWIGWGCAVLAAVAHWLVARRLVGTLGAAAASLLLWSTPMVFEKSMEIRPDTQALAILQIALLALSRSISLRTIAAAFSLLGVGLLFTQKIAFPALGLMVAVWLLLPGRGPRRLWAVAGMISGLVVPTVVCGVYFAAIGGLGPFIEDVFLINLRWKARLAAWPFMMERFIGPSFFFAALALPGLIWGVTSSRTTDPGRRTTLLLVVCSTASGLLGIAMLPVAWEQYYLLFLPQLALLASGVLGAFTGRVTGGVPASAGASVLATLALLSGLAPTREALLRQQLRLSESKDRAIALVLENSSPSDTVLDGYSGIGVFRPHAFRYFFLHAEMRLMLGKERDELAEGLENGTIAPRFASGDSHLSSVSPRVRDFVARHFAPTGVEPVLVRMFPGGTGTWDDLVVRYAGHPPPKNGGYLLFVDGWSERQMLEARTARRSRGKASTILFPVLKPEGLRALALSARAGAGVAGLSAFVRLNGRDLGELSLGTSFSTFDLALPPDLLISGLNRLEFNYPRRPVQIDPALGAYGNEALLLESMALRSGR